MVNNINCTKSFFAAGIIRLLLFVTVFCVLPNSRSFANNNILMLDQWKSYNIAHYFYITPDPERHLSPDTLIRRHKGNLRGTRIRSDVIKVNDAREPIWIVFSVYNKSRVQDWIIDFGDSLNGRMGMIKAISLINHSTKQVFNFPNNSKSRKKTEEGEKNNIANTPFVGPAMAVDIMPGTQNIFVIRIEAQQGFPLVFHPKLLPQHNYMHKLTYGNITHVVAAVFFIGMFAFFIAAFYIRRNKSSLAMASYYTVLCAVFFNFSSSFIPHSLVTGPLLFALYMGGYLLLIMATRCYCNMKYRDQPFENLALVAISGIIALGTALYLAVMGSNVTGLFIISGLISACMLVSLSVLFFLNEKPLINTLLFGTGSALSIFAFIYITLINADIITASSMSVSTFWYIHVLQGAFFVAAYFHTGMYLDWKNILREKERHRDEQSLVRLQKSKESADQARLIRVIERERELMAELREREVKRTEEMRIAKESADKANKAKSAFLAVVSHEIRTPMNGVLGMVQLLQKTTLNKTQKGYIETIRKSSDTMMNLLNDILDFEKIESGGMSLETLNFDIHRLIDDVIILMSGHAAQKNISLSAEIDKSNVPDIVSGDPTRLRQVMLNLINNAIKFTQKGGVTVRVTRQSSKYPNSKDKIRISVKDTGIGISEEGQKKLFTPFTQTESSTTRKYGGTGLGLAISYRLIEVMGGKINVQSVEGQGCSFFFDLDMIIEDEEHKSKDVYEEHLSKEKKDYSTRPMRILVTEDNEMNRKVLDGLLSQKGHTLFMAANGVEALDICRKQTLDLIFMDIQMDGLDGLETTKKLRMEENNEIANIPVIALTGNVMLEDIENFFESGMNGFIAKPIDSNKLDEVIHNASMGKFENNHKQASGNKNFTHTEERISGKNAVSDATLDVFSNNSPQENIDLSKVSTGLKIDYQVDYQKNTDFGQNDNSILDKADTSDFSFEGSKSKIAPNSKENNKNIEEYKKEKNDQITEVQSFLIEQGSFAPIKPSKINIDPNVKKQTSLLPEQEEIKTRDDEPNEIYGSKEFLDLEMLKQLLKTLGKEQFFSLLNGFQDKANEIVDVIDNLGDGEDLATLSGRAHELKGLAGNFGMKKLSSLAGEIEKSARMSQKSEAVKLASGLHDINTQTQEILSKWADDQSFL